uniref:Uncharacterized protein n=1 Tax=Arundo donax TaxID=35708 RepID=A0A0A9AAW7_ARUDO
MSQWTNLPGRMRFQLANVTCSSATELVALQLNKFNHSRLNFSSL